MSNETTRGPRPEGGELNELMGLFDAPAYIRRARAVDDALAYLLGKARQVREEWLGMARLRLGVLHALAGDWSAVRPWLADDDQVQVLESLRVMLAPRLRLPPEPTRSPRALRHALKELLASLERFNVRWAEYLPKVDVTHVNELREGYNRHYVLEKSCALRSDRLAKLGFEPRAPLDLAELQRHLPLLPVPRTVL
jgi:hypothetical protein